MCGAGPVLLKILHQYVEACFQQVTARLFESLAGESGHGGFPDAEQRQKIMPGARVVLSAGV